MNEKRWFVPGYYLDFVCKADKCRHTCCSSWRIPISKNEYNKLITMECSDELNRCVQNAFVFPEVVDDLCYRYVSINWLGYCNLFDNGLCRIQKEKGEEYLPKICRLYPRSFKNIGGHNVASCSSSCERVIEMLYEDNQLDIKEIILDQKPQLLYEVSDEQIEQIRLFQDIIKDKNTSLAQSIIDICRIINKDEFDKDYSSDVDYLDNALSLLQKISSSDYVFKEVADRIIDRYKDKDLFETDRITFEEKYPDWMSFFERVLNNSMIYECFPFIDKKIDKTKVYKGLCCSYGLLRLICIGNTFDSNNIEDLIDVVACLFRIIDHTAFYHNVSIVVDNAAVMLKI